MKALIAAEFKRILRKEIFIFFFAAVLMFSFFSTYQAVKSYELWSRNGFSASGTENLKHGKENAGKILIEKRIEELQEKKEEAFFVDETNIKKLAVLNYPNREIQDLSEKEINLFYENRLRLIEQNLNVDSRFSYTNAEKERFLNEAAKLTSLTVGFAEGWKVLNRDIGNFTPFVCILISVIIMPLFAEDSQTKMKELLCSAKNGKGKFYSAKIFTAFTSGSALYVFASFFYAIIKMLPFGFRGGGEYIQSNEETFFSVFHITYVQQFAGNFIRGYVALLFVISATVFISVLCGKIMEGNSLMCFFWALLFLTEKMANSEVNHFFADFMPLRLSGGIDFFVQNEVYRFAGKTFDGIVWCPFVTLLLSAGMIGISLLLLNRVADYRRMYYNKSR